MDFREWLKQELLTEVLISYKKGGDAEYQVGRLISLVSQNPHMQDFKNRMSQEGWLGEKSMEEYRKILVDVIRHELTNYDDAWKAIKARATKEADRCDTFKIWLNFLIEVTRLIDPIVARLALKRAQGGLKYDPKEHAALLRTVDKWLFEKWDEVAKGNIADICELPRRPSRPGPGQPYEKLAL
jgi:hypothetical protein